MNSSLQQIKKLSLFFPKLEISRRNLGAKLIPYYRYNFRILFIRVLIRIIYYIKIKLLKKYKRINFMSTNLETYGYCNRKCDFCFNSERFKQREKGIMPAETWGKIINELGAINFYGRISLHFYGEPLLDKRLPELIKYARLKCPNAYIFISTNGDFLDEKLFRNLIQSGVNQFFVTNYDDGVKPQLTELEKNYPAHISMRSYKDFLKINRTGEIFGKRIVLNTPCLRPSYQLVINWNGDVLLCCNDYYAICKFGNVNIQTISEIWNCKEFKDYRASLQMGKRETISICKFCNYPGDIPW